MKKLLLLLFLITGLIKVNGQIKPVYFYGDKVTSNKNKATSYAIYGKLSEQDIWMFKRYDLNDNLLQTGSYNDELLTTPHGKFVFYSSIEDYNNINRTRYIIKGKTRFTSQEGEFVNGKEEGKWLTFYPDGNVSSYLEYKGGKMEGIYKEFDKYGNVEVSGNFLNNEKHGEWVSENGTRIDSYENGVRKSTRYVKKTKKVKGEVKN
jgi:antitoxin component YwqK of YwqJK toxin-antitoxin module